MKKKKKNQNKAETYKTKLASGETIQAVVESDYRLQLRNVAHHLGCETELLQIFDKFDGLLRNCKNAQEAKAISTLGVIEVSKLLDNGNIGIGGSVTVDGNVVLEDKNKDKM